MAARMSVKRLVNMKRSTAMGRKSSHTAMIASGEP